MRRPLVLALALAASATGAGADRYSDCRQTEDLKLSIRACTQIIEGGKRESQQNRARAYSSRGVAYMRKGEVDRAFADWTKAIALDTNDATAYTGRGFAYGEKGEVDRAIADFDKAIKLDPRNARAYFGRCKARATKGKYNRAIDDFDKAIKLNPFDAIVFRNRGIAYTERGELDRASFDLDYAIKLNPNDAEAYTGRGLTYEMKGNKKQALADFRKALEINPSNQDAKRGLKRLGVTPDVELRPGIIGTDDRRIIDQEGAPWSAIGHINITGYRTRVECTGSLIASNLVITAAHCVMDPVLRKPWPPRSINFLAGVKRSQWLGHSKAKCLHFVPGDKHTRFLQKINPNLRLEDVPGRNYSQDIALIVLKDSLEDIPPLQIERARELRPDITLTQASYPADRRHMLTGHFGCRLLRRDQHLWYTDCDTDWASLGGPILIQRKKELKLAAVVVGGVRKSYSIAVPIEDWIDVAAKRKCP